MASMDGAPRAMDRAVDCLVHSVRSLGLYGDGLFLSALRGAVCVCNGDRNVVLCRHQMAAPRRRARGDDKEPVIDEAVRTAFDLDSVLRDIGNADSDRDRSVRMDEVVTASLDIEDYGGLNEMELIEIVERRKRQQNAATKGIEEILERKEADSDSEELFVEHPGAHSEARGGATKRNSRKTPRPPPPRKRAEHDDDEEMYQNTVSYGIATDRGSSTGGQDEERKWQSPENGHRQKENVRDWSSDSEGMSGSECSFSTQSVTAFVARSSPFVSWSPPETARISERSGRCRTSL